MDNITVLYKISNECSNNQIPNAFSVSVPKGKEVFLFDIVLYFNNNTSLGIDYIYKADCKDGLLITLESLTSIVPVFDDVITLIMTPCGFCPVVPVGQAKEWIEKSRLELYKNYQRSNPIVENSKNKPKRSIRSAVISRLGFGKSKSKTSESPSAATATQISTSNKFPAFQNSDGSESVVQSPFSIGGGADDWDPFQTQSSPQVFQTYHIILLKPCEHVTTYHTNHTYLTNHKFAFSTS